MNFQSSSHIPEHPLNPEEHKRREAEKSYIDSEQYLIDITENDGHMFFARRMDDEKVSISLHIQRKEEFHLPNELDDNHVLLDVQAKKSLYKSPVHIMLGAEHRDKKKSFYSAQTAATAIVWCLSEKKRLWKSPRNKGQQPGKIIVSLHAAMKFLFNDESPDVYYSEQDQIKRIKGFLSILGYSDREVEYRLSTEVGSPEYECAKELAKDNARISMILEQENKYFSKEDNKMTWSWEAISSHNSLPKDLRFLKDLYEKNDVFRDAVIGCMPERTHKKEDDSYFYVLHQLWIMLRACRAQEYIKFGSMREDRYDALFTRLISGEFDQPEASIFSFGIQRDAASRYGYIRWNDRRGSNLNANAAFLRVEPHFSYPEKPVVIDHASQRREKIRSHVKTVVFSILGAGALFGAASLAPMKKPIESHDLQAVIDGQTSVSWELVTRYQQEQVVPNEQITMSALHVSETAKRLYLYDQARHIHRPSECYLSFEQQARLLLQGQQVYPLWWFMDIDKSIIQTYQRIWHALTQEMIPWSDLCLMGWEEALKKNTETRMLANVAKVKAK